MEKRPKIVRLGYTQAMNGKELWANTVEDEMVKFVVKNKKLRWDMYCKYVKITVETITEAEYVDSF